MPIFERDSRRIFFIHVPKTGGSSVTRLLESEGWVKVDRGINKHLHHEEWSKLDKTWTFEFSLIRNPYERFLSQARWVAQGKKIEKISPHSVLRWAREVFYQYLPTHGKGMDDNHFRPQYEFIGNDTSFYRLEDQIDNLLADLLSKDIVSKNAIFPHANISPGSDVNMVVAWPLVPRLHDKFLNFYSDDFIHLGYSKDVPTFGLDINWSDYQIGDDLYFT